MSEDMRRCKSCGDTLPVSEFYTNGTTTRGTQRYRSCCITCERKRLKQYRKPTVTRVLTCQCGDESRVTIDRDKAEHGNHYYVCHTCFKEYTQNPSEKGNQTGEKDADH